jgi:hypothetical protein
MQRHRHHSTAPSFHFTTFNSFIDLPATQPTMSNSSETSLVVSFGIITLVATLAGLHYRGSLCCLFCRTLIRAWSHSMSHLIDLLVVLGLRIPDTDVDIEAIAGTQHNFHRSSRHDDEAVIALQPRPLCPLYFDSSVIETELDGSTNNIEEGTAPVVLRVE